MGARAESKSCPDTSLDFEAFTEPILKADVKKFRKDPGSARLRVMAELVENRHVWLGVGLTFGALCLGTVDYFLIVGAVVGTGSASLLLGLTAALVSFAILGMVRKARLDAFVASPINAWYRMARFAASNGLGFWAELREPPFAGTVFRRGVDGVASVRQGKVFDIELAGTDKAKAEALLKQAADKLLANTVIENYRVELLET